MNIYDIVHDWNVFVVLQAALGLCFLIAIGLTHRAKGRAGKGSHAVGTMTRGDRSMNFLYVGYGVVTVVYTLGIQVAEAFCGYKVIFIVLDYLVLTYLFFFNSWFRNKLFGIHARIQKD